MISRLRWRRSADPDAEPGYIVEKAGIRLGDTARVGELDAGHYRANRRESHGKAMVTVGVDPATVQSRTVVGQPLTGVPRWSGSLTSQYTIPLGERRAFVRGQFDYTGARTSFNNVAPPDGRALPSYGVLNLRTGLDQGPWEATVFVQNLFDKRGVIGDLIPEGAELAGRPRLFVVRPRTIGLQIRREF